MSFEREQACIFSAAAANNDGCNISRFLELTVRKTEMFEEHQPQQDKILTRRHVTL